MTRPPADIPGVFVQAVQPATSPLPGIAAFAIDTPRPFDMPLGAGLEIGGWVIGQDASVQGVRTIKRSQMSRLYPLDVVRTDVAADYPEFGHARMSGFSAWAPLANEAPGSTIAVEAVLASGETVILAEITAGPVIAHRDAPATEARPVSAPEFVIIGAQRGGTTSLHAYLSAHPQVRTPATKELHFLTDRHERGHDWYLGQYPPAIPHDAVAGEATPYALFHPLAPVRLARIAPHAKLIALLRNPVDRAYSQYLLERSRGFETLDFTSALDAEADRLAGEEARILEDPTYVSEAHKHFSYLARGDYTPQLERWFASVPRDQVLVLRSEDLYAQPAETFARVASFLGIAPELDAPFAAHNRSAGPPLDPAIRTRLTTHFAAKNARLAELLGWDPEWDRP